MSNFLGIITVNSSTVWSVFTLHTCAFHNKSHWALSLTLNPSLVSLSSWPKLSLNPYSLISKTLSNELHGRPSQAHLLTAMGFIFLHSCFMGFIFLWFWLWVHLISFVLASVSILASISAIWSKSRKRVGSGLERIELDLGLCPSLGLCLGHNGAQSRPLPDPLMIAKSLFLSLFLINDGGSGFGYFVSMSFLTNRWVWWLISGMHLWFSRQGGGWW